VRDLLHNLSEEISLQFATMKQATNGQNLIDLAGFEGARIVIYSGTITDGDEFTFELKHGNEADGSDLEAVPDSDLVGSEPVFDATEENKPKAFCYAGPKRYIRIDLKSVADSPATGGEFLGVVLKGFPRHAPVS